MTSELPDTQTIAERLGFPIAKPYRQGVAEAYGRLWEQALLVLSAEVGAGPDSVTDFVP